MLTNQLQDIVDGLSRLAAASATLEDRDFNLVAFASQSGGLDQVRQQSILQRRSITQKQKERLCLSFLITNWLRM